MAVEVVLRGGLGNQLFQVSGGFHYAELWKTNLFINEKLVYKHSDKTRRNIIANIDLKVFFGTDIQYSFIKRPRLFFKKLDLGSNMLSEDQVLKFDEKSQFIDNQRILHGYFQSARYVPTNLLNRKGLGVDETTNLHKKDGAIHLRFGDYVSHGWALPDSYYLLSTKILLTHKPREIHVYSDSINRAKKLLYENFPSKIFKFPEDNHTFGPIALMSRLSRYSLLVSSNSSLAWWASVLGLQEKRLVIFPNQWREQLSIDEWSNVSFV